MNFFLRLKTCLDLGDFHRVDLCKPGEQSAHPPEVCAQLILDARSISANLAPKLNP